MIRPNIVYVPLFYPFNNSLNNNNNILNNNHNIQLTQNNFNSRISIGNNIEKEEEKNIIKYSWLKKEKFTIEIMNKKKDGYECSICLENIQLINDINILKCGHIFHYKCIENLVDHNINKCPNCRCDLKTGEKQSINQNTQNTLFNDFPEDDLFLSFNDMSYLDYNDIIDEDDHNNSYFRNSFELFEEGNDYFEDFYEEE